MEDESNEITLHEVTVSQESLMQAPEMERLFFILLGHFGNELLIISKMHIATHNVATSTTIEERAQHTQSVFLLKLVMAKMFEGWEKLFQQIYLGNGLCLTYDSQLSPKGLSALKELKNYFGKTSYISKLRNIFTFHYPDRQLIAAIPKIPKTEDWKIYLNRTHGNSLYYASDMIAGHALMAEIDPDIEAAFKRLSEDRVFLSGSLLTLIHACMVVFIRKHLDLKLSAETEVKITVPKVAALQLPYFAVLT